MVIITIVISIIVIIIIVIIFIIIMINIVRIIAIIISISFIIIPFGHILRNFYFNNYKCAYKRKLLKHIIYIKSIIINYKGMFNEIKI